MQNNQNNQNSLPAEIFKAYDIRGIVDKTLTPEIVEKIGKVLGSLALENQQNFIAVGRDGRLSGEKLANALINGIISTGCNAYSIGCVPTPTTYFAANFLENCNSCISVTGSHNPPEYNGIKMVINGKTLALDDIQNIKKRADNNDFQNAQNQSQNKGKIIAIDNIIENYIQRICSDVKINANNSPLKVIIDCGNGVAGKVAPKLFESLGCIVTPLFCEVDGNFPNHHPDPSKPENLQDLIKALQNSDAQIGLAFDGDGDRLGVVTKNGNIIFADRQLMLFAENVLENMQNAEIVYDVKCTRLLNGWIAERGGVATMWKTGHALIKQKLKQTKAALAGEMSGHMFFNDSKKDGTPRWFGFDDGLYSGARLLEILADKVQKDPTQTFSDILNNLPNSPSTPELNIKLNEGEPFLLIEKLQQWLAKNYNNDQAKVITLDGVRIEFADGFGLIRASNTTPVVVLRFEADNQKALQRIQNDFKTLIKSVWDCSKIEIPF